MKNFQHAFGDSDYLEYSPMVKMAKHFDDLATGRSQVPSQLVKTRVRDRISNEAALSYHDMLVPKAGPLFSHFLASVPCILEEMSHVGAALSKVSRQRAASEGRSFTFYEVDAFDGTNGRTLAEFSDGRIKTFTNSPNKANEGSFRKSFNPKWSHFYPESFLRVNSTVFEVDPQLAEFRNGFDYIYETVAFQFYGKDRANQISHLFEMLKDDGLMFLLEKLIHPDAAEYSRRELIKDDMHKAQYFTPEEIAWKKTQMLSQMQNGQVNFETLVKAIRTRFTHVYMIWNSTNFYEFVASNSKARIDEFIAALGENYIPLEFCFERPMIIDLSQTLPRTEPKALDPIAWAPHD